MKPWQSVTPEPFGLANAEPNQKTAVIPADKDKEALPDGRSHGRSRTEHPPFHDDVHIAKSAHKAHAAHPANGHSSSRKEVEVGRGGKPAANGHANGVAKDLEHGADGDAKHADRGMVLPFSPVTVTFRDLHYFVPLPEVRVCGTWPQPRVAGHVGYAGEPS